MHSALNHLGKLISADQKGVYWANFTCPNCGEAVFHRGGRERKAHFAHYSHSGDEECELYFHGPSAGTLQSTGPSGEASDGAGQSSRRACLCLETTDGRRAHLQIRLPLWSVESAAPGGLVIRSTKGESTVPASRLLRPTFVRVDLSCPPAKCTSFGECDGAERDVNRALGVFRFSNNYFRAGVTGGALIPVGAPLRLGESYWLVQQGALLPNVPRGLTLQRIDEFMGWITYRVDLLTESQIKDFIPIDDLQFFLGRKILPAMEQATVRSPFPHHYDPDGTAIYGEETKELRVFRPHGSTVTLEGSAVENAACENMDDGSEILIVTGLGLGELTIKVGDEVHFSARLEVCQPFRPEGVRISSGEDFIEIFTASARTALLEANERTLKVPSARVWPFLRTGCGVDESANPSISILRATNFVDADNFGEIVEMQEEALEGASDGNQSWVGVDALLGIVKRKFGTDTAQRLQDFQGDTVQLARWAAAHGLVSLYPQIVELKRIRS